MSATNIDENLRHEKMQAEIAKLFAEIEKMRGNNQKTIEETRKITKETTLYPLVVGASLILVGGSAAIGVVAVVKLFL